MLFRAEKAKYKMEITVTIFKMISIGLYRRDVIAFLLSFLPPLKKVSFV